MDLARPLSLNLKLKRIVLDAEAKTFPLFVLPKFRKKDSGADLTKCFGCVTYGVSQDFSGL